ncbi:XTP/dITP diphosphatase [Kiritimatiella glycovorans]|uniref:dITP/XTP pyrophosphatase n=1 Tax=Kiritimatiella glycovorans TaxID=1307763 RepID=A0A0G3EKV7_9BACT|nr:XTP/dITP diphosphatase [Kiritimatiella glycovorans]AKJ65390.1 Non-canonical purine NTP pyrophosphatase [Kiritimatiella glycovorans]
MKLVLATRNPHKREEIEAIFDGPGLDIVALDAFPDAPEVEEDRDTFEGNAIKKAVEIARWTGLRALADDSGLEVDALGGAPGVWSARYAGPEADYEANNRKLLAALAGAGDRTARFRTVMALADPDGTVRTVEGSCEGAITEEPRGMRGFGYDPLFVLRGDTRTFAELDAAEKNRVSHRARALHKAREAWTGLLSEEM